MSIRNLVVTLNGQWQLRLTLSLLCCLAAEGQLFPSAHEPVSHSTEVRHMQTLHALERNCTIHHYSNSKSTSWSRTVFHSAYVTGWLVARTGETRNVYWILEGTCSGNCPYKRPKLHGYVGSSPGLYQMVAFGSSGDALPIVATIQVVANHCVENNYLRRVCYNIAA